MLPQLHRPEHRPPHDEWQRVGSRRHDIGFGASAVAVVVLAIALPAPFSFYPSIDGSIGTSTVVAAGALALAVLAPFAQRRGIAR